MMLKDSGTIEIVAPLSQRIVNIEDVPDCSLEKLLSDGIAIKPTGNKMVAPVDVPSVKSLENQPCILY